jgi:hypothetical protein
MPFGARRLPSSSLWSSETRNLIFAHIKPPNAAQKISSYFHMISPNKSLSLAERGVQMGASYIGGKPGRKTERFARALLQYSQTLGE